MMLTPRMISSSLARIGDGIAKLVTWVIFSIVYYFVITILPFDFMGSVVIGGWVGMVFDIVRIAVSVAFVYLYLYYSYRIFTDKNFPLTW